MIRRNLTADGLSRRAVLSGSAALCVTGLPAPYAAMAQAAPHRFKVGAAEVTVLSDGAMAAPLSFILPDRKREDVAEVYTAAGRTLGEINLQVNVALVRLGNEVILIDAGSGPDFAPARGKLADNLSKAGIQPEMITRVVFTHAHPDHFWGVVDPLDGGSMFPKARHHLSTVERDYWLKPGIEASMPDAARGTALGTQRRLKEFGDRIETFKVGAEIVPGLGVLDSAGHTPGHVAILLRSGSEQVVIGGDALTEPVISFARPTWRWGADLDPDRAVASRQRLLDMMAGERIPLLGYHLPWPGLGRVERHQGAYRFAQS